MATPASALPATPQFARSRTLESARAPWSIYAVLFASLSVILGVIWDISWHRSIGRDTFWTPAHMMIYASGIIAGLSCGGLVLRTTFTGTSEERAATVGFWGFRGPLGAWLCIWGALAMVTSAPFDNWWHNAYGVDVKILSPPHAILGLGFTAIELGALLMVLALQNRAAPGAERRYGRLVAYGAGVLLTNNALFALEQNGFPNAAHNGTYYVSAAIAFPVVLAMVARAAKLRWPATCASVVYLAITLVMLWTLERFPATPRLAPVYRPLTHMVPPPFPILMVVPALAVDWLMHHWKGISDWVMAVGVGLGFLLALLVTQWLFSYYLISPASENWIFGVGRWNYDSRPGPFEHDFWDAAHPPAVFARALGIATFVAIAGSRLGLALGSWMSRVKR